MRARRVVVSLTFGLVWSGCSVGDFRFDNRECPCLDGWVCDAESNQCLDPDAGAVDVVSFKAGWATPNWIRWEWEIEGSEDDFGAFQLIVGESPEDVRTRTNVTVIDGARNPELSYFRFPETQLETDEVLATATDEHRPNTVYYAQLVVIDALGNKSFSHDIAQRRTTRDTAVKRVVVFEDDDTGQTSRIPSCIALDGSSPYSGTHAFSLVNYCDPDGEKKHCSDPNACCQQQTNAAPLCWNQMNFGTDLEFVPSEGDFADAYLQFALQIERGSEHALWASVGIQDGPNQLAGYFPITYRADGAYRVYQIPLSAFPKSRESYGERFTGITLGGTVRDAHRMLLDGVAVYW